MADDADFPQPASEPAGGSSHGGDVATRHLRSALEFAVLIAREGPKLKPPLAVPQGLRRYVKADRLNAAALNSVRRVLDGDDEFRTRLGAGATDELVDEVGRLWLQRPVGWHDAIAEAASRIEQEAADADLARRLARAEKRRDAAERAAARSAAELIERDTRIDDLEAEIAELRSTATELTARVDSLSAELSSAKMDARHARDRENAAAERERAAHERAEALAAESVQPDVATPPQPPVDDDHRVRVEPEVLERLSAAATELAKQLADVADPADPKRAGPAEPGDHSGAAVDDADSKSGGRASGRRRPLRMPPGVLGNTVAGARFLFRSGAPVLVDGYNVSKLAWDRLDLADQRDRLVTALEMVARRYGTEIVVVFDGADVIGPPRGRHTGVRVVFSAADESADDWIRAETRRLISNHHVVVVTNDREIIDSVTAIGANHVATDRLIELLD